MERIIKINQIKIIHQKIKIIGFFLCFTILANQVFAQKHSTKPFLAVKLMPVEFRKQIKTVNSEFKFAYGMRLDSTMRDIRNYNADQIRNFIHHETDYEKIFRCPFWIAMDSVRFCTLIPELINDLVDTTYLGLTNANDVNIWCRIRNGDLKQTSFNYQIDDDIFKVCGRASWILKRLTKNKFGNIRCETTLEDMKIIQKQWIKWLNSLKEK